MSFERILFRATRGNMFLKVVRPVEAAPRAPRRLKLMRDDLLDAATPTQLAVLNHKFCLKLPDSFAGPPAPGPGRAAPARAARD